MIESRPFVPVLAAVGGVILLHQAVDLAMLLPGTDFAIPAGRVHQLLAVEARSPGLVSADLLILWAMTARRSGQALRVAGTLHLAVGALLLVLLPVFLLDAGSLASEFGGAEATAFRVVVTRTLLMLAILGLGGLLAGRALFSAAQTP